MNFFQSLSSKIQYKRSRLTSQVWAHSSPLPLAEVVSNPPLFFEQLTEAQRAVLNYFLVRSNAYHHLYFSQSTIAQDLGYSRGFVNRTLKIFEATGLIASNYRHKKSSLYKISSWFGDMKVRASLARFFRAFIWFPVALLSSQFTGTVTQKDLSFSKYNHVSSPYKDNSDNIARLVSMILKRNPIPDSIRELKELNLTKWGQIKLCAFPDAAIEYASKQLKYANNATDKFRWFFAVCREWCDENKIVPNWHRVQLLEREHDAPLHANMTMNQSLVVSAKINKSVRVQRIDHVKAYVNRGNFDRAEKESKYQEKIKKEKDSQRLESMTQQEADFEAAKIASIHPLFGPISAKAFLKSYQEAQDKKKAAV